MHCWNHEIGVLYWSEPLSEAMQINCNSAASAAEHLNWAYSPAAIRDDKEQHDNGDAAWQAISAMVISAWRISPWYIVHLPAASNFTSFEREQHIMPQIISMPWFSAGIDILFFSYSAYFVSADDSYAAAKRPGKYRARGFGSAARNEHNLAYEPLTSVLAWMAAASPVASIAYL